MEVGWFTDPSPRRRPIGTKHDSFGAYLVNGYSEVRTAGPDSIKIYVSIAHRYSQRHVEVITDAPSHFGENNWHIRMSLGDFVYKYGIPVIEAAGKLGPCSRKLSRDFVFG